VRFFPEMCVKNAKRRPKIITGWHQPSGMERKALLKTRQTGITLSKGIINGLFINYKLDDDDDDDDDKT